MADASHATSAGQADARAPPASVAGIESGAGAITAGGVVSRTTIRAVEDADAPRLSVTISAMSCEPSASVVEIEAPEPSGVVPSNHANVSVSPASASVPDPVSITVAPDAEVASNGAYVPALADGALLLSGRATTNGESDEAWPHTLPSLLPVVVMFTQLPDSKCRS